MVGVERIEPTKSIVIGNGSPGTWNIYFTFGAIQVERFGNALTGIGDAGAIKCIRGENVDPISSIGHRSLSRPLAKHRSLMHLILTLNRRSRCRVSTIRIARRALGLV